MRATEAIEAACRAVQDAKGKWPFVFQVERLVRVEITHDVELEIVAWLADTFTIIENQVPHVGPMQIGGVSYYVVERLPEPGWRVIGLDQ